MGTGSTSQSDTLRSLRSLRDARLEPVSIQILGLPSTHYGRKEHLGTMGRPLAIEHLTIARPEVNPRLTGSNRQGWLSVEQLSS